MMARWIWLVLFAFAIGGCGGSAGGQEVGSAASHAGAADADDDRQDGDATAGAGDAPVTAVVDGVTYAYPVGTCTVSDEHVEADAGTDVSGGETLGFLNVAWRSDESIASFSAYSAASGAPAPFELHADVNRAETRWEVTVDASVATIDAHMANELPAAAGDPDVAFYDVSIRIDCAERGFGGMPAPAEDEADATPMPEASSATAGESQVSLELGDTTFRFTQMGCPMEEDFFAFAVADAELTRLFVSTEEVSLVTPDGTVWRATGIEWAGGTGQVTWSGTMSSPAGGGEQATIEIAC